MTAAKELLASLAGAPGTNGTAPEKAPIRAFAWARVSTDEQGERGHSIEEQLRQIRDYAGTKGIQIVGEFQEVASAFQREDRRIEFHRMIERAKADSAVNAVLCHDWSRFSRDSLRARTLVRELRDAGKRVISVTDPETDPDTVAGVYMEAIFHAKNEAYSREVAFHTRKGCRANVQARDPETTWAFKNGGQPLFGYRAQKVKRGTDSRGRTMEKTIWVLDDTIVAGRPLHQWARECLLMAAGGASLNQLRDFCEENAIPARRKAHWGTSTWNALLQPHVLMKYCGHEVYNVHTKRGTLRPREEWVVVEDAHPAILAPEEAQAIVEARKRNHRENKLLPGGRARLSPYLLTGGLFRCGRCGANMVGLKGAKRSHYICGSLPYRRGRGCGPGVYVPVPQAEQEALEGIRELVAHCDDPKGFAKQVNAELARLWKEGGGTERAEAEKKLSALDGRIANVRKAVEDGFNDAEWANRRLVELQEERARLQVQIGVGVGVQNRNCKPPRVNVEEAMRLRKDLDQLLEHATLAEKKQLVRTWVSEMKLAPETRQVDITYRVPEPIMITLVAGAGLERDHDVVLRVLGPWLRRRMNLPRNGSHGLERGPARAPVVRRGPRSRAVRPLPLVSKRRAPRREVLGARCMERAS